jgi:phosphoribosylaminoimidazolecarboxamide formyltransferase/IMP cyclohydrolase
MGKKRALVSVSDKAGIEAFCAGLIERGYEIVSTGGTLKSLAAAGVQALQVSQVTSMPEILGGRVKTLHPSIFGGILARRNETGDMATIEEHGMEPIDVVVVNLYPFAQTLANPKADDERIIENVDIGGPSLLRAAAKNHRDVYVVVDPADYQDVLDAVGSGRSADYRRLRRRLAAKVFAHTAEYDRIIAGYMSGTPRGVDGEKPAEGTTSATDADSPTPNDSTMPETLELRWPRRAALRYGENPHQNAAFYTDPLATPPSMAHCTQLQGKELSYNNYMDGETALEMVREFGEPACVILKHSNPSGAAWGDDCLQAYKDALSCDPTSAFGGIIGVNRPMDGALAEEIGKMFMEVIIAPAFTDEAKEIFAKKKNLRLLETGPLTPRAGGLAMRSINGGMLVMDADIGKAARADIKIVTEIQPTEDDWDGLGFAWLVCKWVKSNAIVYTDRNKTLGIGAGQMSRVDAARIGLEKAEGRTKGGYLASDAFMPFRDVVDIAHEAGVRAIIQPGGSIRDQDSIDAANERGIVMVFTGMRHFRH